MKTGFEIEVPKQMLPPFKENFLDEVYLQGFDELNFENDSPTIIDIGGNVGYFSLYVLSKFEKAKVLTYEPMPFNFGQLKKYNDSYSEFDWTVENKGVAKDDSGITLYSSTLDGFATMSTMHADDRRSKSIQVETVSFDQIIKNYNLQKVDLLKFDCEGSEYNILYNISKDNLSKIQYLSIETHFVDNDKANHKAILEYVKSHGFETRDIEVKSDSGYIWAWK